MGLAGKILAIFNVLAAIGFLTVAIMDYGKQHAWATLLFQEQILREGMPVDETVLDENGEVIAKKIGAYSQQQLVSTGKAVTTQVAEVKDRQAAVQSAIGAKEIAGTEFNIEIAPVTVELAPNRVVSTIGYNGSSPGPLRASVLPRRNCSLPRARSSRWSTRTKAA